MSLNQADFSCPEICATRFSEWRTVAHSGAKKACATTKNGIV